MATGGSMKTLTVHGYGDDLIYFRNITSADTLVPNTDLIFSQNPNTDLIFSQNFAEYDCNLKQHKPAVFIVNNQIKITADYNNVSTWCFMPEMIDVCGAFPDWPIRILKSTRSKRSLQLEIDIPDNEIHVTRIQ